MELLAVDAPRSGPKNGVVIREELHVIGPKLRGLRVARGLKQSDVVRDPKAGGLKLGTLQAIEGAWYDVRDANVEKYARFFGTTREELRQADQRKAVTPTDPRLQDLNDEHLEIARRYMRATTRMRLAIESLLSDPIREHALISLLEKLQALSAERIAEVERFILTRPEVAQLVERIRQHCAADPSYFELLLKNDALEQHTIDRLAAPSAKPAQKKALPPGRS